MASFRTTFRALKHRNYRLFFCGQGVSLIGTWMQQIAEVWLAYRLTHSAFYLGVVGFASQLPISVVAPLAGVWIDRVDRRKLLILTQTLEMLQAFALAGLTLTHRVNLLWLIVLSLLGGIVDAIDIPTRQSLMVQLVEDRADLGNAIALNSSLVNVARLIGPSMAGLIIGMVGEGWCFFINGVSYLAVIVSLLLTRLRHPTGPLQEASARSQLLEGWRYMTGSPAILTLLGVMAMMSLIVSANGILVPIFAARILKGDARTLGFLMAGSGIGALSAALALAARQSVVGLLRWIRFSVLLLAGCLFVFSFSRMFWLSWLAIGGAGFGMMAGTASINTVLQTIVEERMRGRLMSFFATAFLGVAPFGNILSGLIADRLGAPATVMAASLFCLAAAVIYMSQLPRLRAHIRPIYERLGLLPGMAEGLRTASELKR